MSDLLVRLHSENWIERSDAVEEIRSHPEALHSRKIQTALTDLLDREEREADESLPKDLTENRPDENGGAGQEGGAVFGGAVFEGYGEYIGWLAETVRSFADWNDPRQVCLLVNAATVDCPSSPAEAAAHARAAMPCILKMAEDEQEINRAIAIPMRAEALARGKDALDSRTVQSAKLIVLNDLHDSDAGVRSSTVVAIRHYRASKRLPTGIDLLPTFGNIGNCRK